MRRLVGHKREIIPGKKYHLEVSAGYDPVTGKRRRISETFYGNDRDAELRLSRMTADTGKGGTAAVTLWEYIERLYLPAIAPPELRKRTVDGYREKLERYVKPSGIATVRLDRLDRYAMVSWMRSVKEQVPNKQTQRHIYSALSGALARAVAWGYMNENVLRTAVKPPKPGKYTPPVLTEDEMNAYLDAFEGDTLEPIVVLGLAGALRPSEAQALEWSDVDFDLGGVRVTKGKHQRGGEVWIEPVKNEDSRRFVALPSWAMERLRVHRGLGPIIGDMTPNQLRYRYKKRVGELGLDPWCPMENLRHTSLTVASERGLGWSELSARAGHTSEKMLRERYVQRRLLRDQRGAKVMENVRQLSPRDDSSPSFAIEND